MIVFHLPSDEPPIWLKSDLPPGFHTTRNGTEELRVFVRVNKSPGESPEESSGKRQSRTVVAKPTESRDEIAVDSALYTLVPLLLFMPLIVGLTIFIIRKEFAPISCLAKRVDKLPADRPELIVDEELPHEIMPFVHASYRLLRRVNQLVVQQRRFVANAAHELRTPLTALSVQAQNLLQADTLEAMQQRSVPLRVGIDRACRLTEQLLGFARTQVGAQNNIDIDVSAMTRELLAEQFSAAERLGGVATLHSRTGHCGLVFRYQQRCDQAETNSR